MPSRTDQLHSYQFMVQRVVAALVMRETDPARSPFRRVAGATLASVLFAALGLGGALAYGLFSQGGSTRWKDPKAVIVEKESGAVFIYRADTHRLHPVVNYSSALLIVGQANANRVSVAHHSLDGVARGVTLGIPDAPDSLPAGKQLSTKPWTICSIRTDGSEVRSVLFVARDAGTGGKPLEEGDERDKARALLVTTPDDTRYLIFKHRRHLLRDPDSLLPRLVWNRQPPLPVAAAFVNALPAGVDFPRLATTITGFGSPLTAPAGGRAGQVYAVNNSGGDGQEFFVARAEGLAALTPLQAEMLLADPLYQSRIGRTEATNLDRSAFAKFGTNILPFLPKQRDGALPDTAPNLTDPPSGAVCAPVSGSKGAAEVRLGVPVTVPAAAAATTARSAAGTVLADRVDVEPGSGVLVAADSSSGASQGAMSLVTDTGKRYAVPSDAVRASLGYKDRRPVRMPAELVALIPAGPALDPQVADDPVAGP